MTVPVSSGRPSQAVYLLHAIGTYRFKIGRSGNPERRLRQLSTGSPYELRILGQRRFRNAAAEERRLHDAFAPARVSGEWFQLDARSLLLVARRITADFGLHYTKRDVVEFASGDIAWISWDSRKAIEVEVLGKEAIWYDVRIKRPGRVHFLRLDEVRPDPLSAIINRVTL